LLNKLGAEFEELQNSEKIDHKKILTYKTYIPFLLLWLTAIPAFAQTDTAALMEVFRTTAAVENPDRQVNKLIIYRKKHLLTKETGR